jgi:hypothetical protein
LTHASGNRQNIERLKPPVRLTEIVVLETGDEEIVVAVVLR